MDAIDIQVLERIDSLCKSLARHEKHALYGPAAFWNETGENHKALIRQHGFRQFKRTINFEYHQWKVQSFTDSKIKRLLKQLLRRGRIPYGPLLTRINRNSMRDIPQIRSLPYAVFMGLLWQYAAAVDWLGCLDRCEEPKLGDALPVTYRGRLISQDLATSAIELNSIAAHVDLAKVKRIGEIGSGYGRLAYVTAIRFPHTDYCLFDIPPALVIAENYLAETLGDSVVQRFQEQVVDTGKRVRAFLPHQLELFPDGSLDLVINISSFDEMSREQVDHYFSLIDRKGRGWLYVKGHARAPSWCQTSGGGITELPYRDGWKLVHESEDPFSPTFVERIYALH